MGALAPGLARRGVELAVVLGVVHVHVATLRAMQGCQFTASAVPTSMEAKKLHVVSCLFEIVAQLACSPSDNLPRSPSYEAMLRVFGAAVDTNVESEHVAGEDPAHCAGRHPALLVRHPRDGGLGLGDLDRGREDLMLAVGDVVWVGTLLDQRRDHLGVHFPDPVGVRELGLEELVHIRGGGRGDTEREGRDAENGAIAIANADLTRWVSSFRS